jgi:hypothetical protein
LKISNLQNKKPRDNTTNLPKNIKIYNAKYSYRRHPTAKKANNKLKKTRKADHPLHHFNRTVPATTAPEEKGNLYSAATRSSRKPKLTCTGPALHTAETHTTNIYMTRLAREKPTDPAHPIKKNRT